VGGGHREMIPERWRDRGRRDFWLFLNLLREQTPKDIILINYHIGPAGQTIPLSRTDFLDRQYTYLINIYIKLMTFFSKLFGF
jgi:hypothetical protein